MKNLKRLALAVTLMSVLAAVSYAGETGTPPCTPGETGTPPCSQIVSEDPTLSGETGTPPASDTLDMVDIVDVALWSLTLF